ncbi:ABC transporter permease, partial [Rhodospirillum rubrum]
GLGLAGQVAITLLGLLLVTFLIGRLTPIDPLLALLGDRASAATYAAARQRLGLDLPLWRQFAVYAGEILRGNLGRSTLTGQPVLADIAQFFPATFELASLAIFFGVVFGVPGGVVAATHKGAWPDHVLRLVTLVGYSVPIFWLGIVGLVVFYAKLDWVAGPGRIDILYQDIPAVTGLMLVDTVLARSPEAFLDALRHLILPAAILGYYAAAVIARMTRAAMLAELSQDYILTARVKGLGRRRVIWGHAFPNALVPIITIITLSYASLLEGAVLTETIFAWPGLGLYITQSLFNADLTAVLGGTLVVGVLFIGLNLLADLFSILADPRVR